jgi:hypothetical protein
VTNTQGDSSGLLALGYLPRNCYPQPMEEGAMVKFSS